MSITVVTRVTSSCRSRCGLFIKPFWMHFFKIISILTGSLDICPWLYSFFILH